jgi:N-acetylglucosamine-6-phosphate deacetylase
VSSAGFEITGCDPATGRALAVRVEDGVVSALAPAAVTDDAWIAPGLVDLQANGFRGHDVNAPDADAQTVAAMVHALHQVGVTTIVPTVVTASEDAIVHALRQVAAARAADPLVWHAVPYVHVEGPHLSEEDGPRGVHAAEHLRPPDVEEFLRWQRACGDVEAVLRAADRRRAARPRHPSP